MQGVSRAFEKNVKSLPLFEIACVLVRLDHVASFHRKRDIGSRGATAFALARVKLGDLDARQGKAFSSQQFVIRRRPSNWLPKKEKAGFLLGLARYQGDTRAKSSLLQIRQNSHEPCFNWPSFCYGRPHFVEQKIGRVTHSQPPLCLIERNNALDTAP
jgi:hypothetical protein